MRFRSADLGVGRCLSLAGPDRQSELWRSRGSLAHCFSCSVQFSRLRRVSHDVGKACRSICLLFPPLGVFAWVGVWTETLQAMLQAESAHPRVCEAWQYLAMTWVKRTVKIAFPAFCRVSLIFASWASHSCKVSPQMVRSIIFWRQGDSRAGAEEAGAACGQRHGAPSKIQVDVWGRGNTRWM